MKFSDLLMEMINRQNYLNSLRMGDPYYKQAIQSLMRSMEAIDEYVDEIKEKEKTEFDMTHSQKLALAQDMLSDVYHDACLMGNNQLESLMSVADSCITEAMDLV